LPNSNAAMVQVCVSYSVCYRLSQEGGLITRAKVANVTNGMKTEAIKVCYIYSIAFTTKGKTLKIPNHNIYEQQHYGFLNPPVAFWSI